MKLFVDRGNSSVKWGVHDGSDWVAEGRFVLDDRGRAASADLEGIPPVETIFHASVAADERDAALLEQLETTFGCAARRLHTCAEAAGVRCAYREPSRLGVDRWLAAVAAHDPARRAIVIDAGTAITIDVVEADGQHRGGLIVPGIDLMRRALYSSTDRIPDEGVPEPGPEHQGRTLLGQDTRAAVGGGSLHAAAGFIDRVVGRLLDEDGQESACLMTGGDASRLAPLLECDVDLRPRLVLEGMLRVSRDADVSPD